MGRRILFITTDQMRFDAIGVNDQKIARTPAIDDLARQGINFTRCHAQNVVCVPARATMITGQYVSTQGVWMNGVGGSNTSSLTARPKLSFRGFQSACASAG